MSDIKFPTKEALLFYTIMAIFYIYMLLIASLT